MTIQELKQKLADLHAQAKAIQEVADNEKRELSGEEAATIEGINASFASTETDISRRETLEAQASRLSSVTRVTVPADIENSTTTPAPRAGATTATRITGGTHVLAGAGTGGFRTLGEMAQLVKIAATNGHVDPRLRVLNAATSYGSEGTGADGGYLVPPDFRQTILTKVFGEESLIGRTDQNPTSSNSITVPVDETTPWQTSGGVQATWEGEASAMAQSKPALQAMTVRAHKLTALVPVTDELLEDASSLQAYLQRKVPEKMTYKINDAILNGDGVGKPRGVLQSPCLVTQAAEGGQAVDTVKFENISKMWSRMYAPCRKNAVWVINQDLEPQLDNLVVPAPAGSIATPAYLPPGGLSGAAYPTLKGRPVIYSEAAAALGDVGDISLIDFSMYLSVVKSGGVRSDVSIHLWFDQGLTAFRFVFRVGGQCWWSAPISRAKSANTLSCCVALAAR